MMPLDARPAVQGPAVDGRFRSEGGAVYTEQPLAVAKLKPEDVARRIGGKLTFISSDHAMLTDVTGQSFITFSIDDHRETHASLSSMGGNEHNLDDTAVLLGQGSVTFVAKGRYLPYANSDRLFEWFKLTRAGTSHHIERVNKYTPPGEITTNIYNASYDSSLRRRTRED